MTRRATSCPQTNQQRRMPLQRDSHEALMALVHLLARAEARRWLAKNGKGLKQNHDEE